MSDLQTFYAVQELQQQIAGIRADFKGKRLFQACFMISMVFDQPKSPATQAKLLDCLKLYQHWTSEELTWWVAEGGRPKNLDKFPVDLSALEAMSLDEDEALGFALGSGLQPLNDRLNHAQDFTITALANSFMSDSKPAAVQMYFPVDWVLKQQDGWSFYSLARGLMERLSPLHATAGLGLCIPQEGGHFRRDIGEGALAYEMAKRHPGIEICDSYTMRYFKTGIYSVNWLNFVCDNFVDRLGGLELVKKQCEDLELPCRGVGQGLLIEAGAGPAPGDTQDSAQELVYYKRAMKVLKPLRVAAHSNRMLTRPKPGFDENYDARIGEQACMAYLTRFDDSPIPYPV
jgi:Protein of unknown function (DUF3396)